MWFFGYWAVRLKAVSIQSFKLMFFFGIKFLKCRHGFRAKGKGDELSLPKL